MRRPCCRRTPRVHSAARRLLLGRVEVAHRLLAAGAEPSTPSPDRFLQITPLGSAVATTPGVPQPSQDEDVVLTLVRLLLDHGAEPDHP